MNILLILMCILSSSAIPLTIYNNARFQPNISDWFSRNFSSIITRDQCACQCYFDQWCLTANYIEIDQQCSMFSTRLDQGQLYVITTNKNASVLYLTDKILPSMARLTSRNETIYGIWNTTAGSNSYPSFLGNSTGNYYLNEEPKNVFDQSTDTKYTSFGVCNDSFMGVECGLNTGVYLTLQRGQSLLKSIRFCTAYDRASRDPLTITIEGSDAQSYALPYGSSWSLIYNGSTNLDPVMGRKKCGENQTISNNFLWYASYRILITSKRTTDVATQYSEIDLFGY